MTAEELTDHPHFKLAVNTTQQIMGCSKRIGHILLIAILLDEKKQESGVGSNFISSDKNAIAKHLSSTTKLQILAEIGRQLDFPTGKMLKLLRPLDGKQE